MTDFRDYSPTLNPATPQEMGWELEHLYSAMEDIVCNGGTRHLDAKQSRIFEGIRNDLSLLSQELAP